MLSVRLKKLRKEKGVTQTDLANILNIAKTTLASYEQGKSEPSLDTLSKIADYFHVTTDYLIGRSDGRTLKDQEIYNRLGLSDDAIFCLEQFVKLSKKDSFFEKQLRNINVLIGDFETMHSISEYLNTALHKEQYVVCNYYVSQHGEDLLNAPDSIEKVLTQAQWSNVFFTDIQKNLTRLRDALK